MFTIKKATLLFLFALLPRCAFAGEIVDGTAELVAAVRDGTEGLTIEIAPGLYELEAPLEPKPGMTL